MRGREQEKRKEREGDMHVVSFVTEMRRKTSKDNDNNTRSW